MKEMYKACDGELIEKMRDCAIHEEELYNNGIQFYAFGVEDYDPDSYDLTPHFIPLDWREVTENLYNHGGDRIDYIYCATAGYARYTNNLLADADIMGLEVRRAGLYRWAPKDRTYKWIQEEKP